MKTTTAVLATLLSVSGAAAECFFSGVPWFNDAEAKQHVINACKGYNGNRGAYQGWWQPGESKHLCVNSDHSANHKYDFYIENLNPNFPY